MDLMNHNFLTIYEVADALGLHHKTIRGFINSGKLKAVKVGKQWRITREDLDVFVGRNPSLEKKQNIESTSTDFKNSEILYTNNPIKSYLNNRISISAVVDIKEVCKTKFERMSNTLIAVMNSKDVKMEGATIHIKYDDVASVCKVFLWGNAEYINEMLSIITLLDKADC